jgi:hypothetical protein
MTAPVPEARLAQDYPSALRLVERFLALFPGYLQALRMPDIQSQLAELETEACELDIERRVFGELL